MQIEPAARPRARHRGCGFTIVELMVALAVAGVLAMVAVPSFRHLMLSNRLSTSANALADAINTARLDAIKLNAATQFCGSTTSTNGTDALGANCGTAAGAVYSLPQSATTAGEVRSIPAGIGAPIQFAGAGVSAVRFSGQGFGYAPSDPERKPFNDTVAVVCTTELSSDNQRVITMTAGSIIAIAPATGTCP